MSKLRRHMGANTPAVVETKSLKALKAKTGNLIRSSCNNRDRLV